MLVWVILNSLAVTIKGAVIVGVPLGVVSWIVTDEMRDHWWSP